MRGIYAILLAVLLCAPASAQRFVSGVTDQYIYFVAISSTDYTTRLTGLSSFTVRRSRNGGAEAGFTTPTVAEVDATDMPGVYKLLLDEDMTIDPGDFSQEFFLYITHAGMVPRDVRFELYQTTSSDSIASVTGTADSGSTTTITDAARTEADVDYWKGMNVEINSGSAIHQIRLITAFDPTTDTITVDRPFTQAISTNNYSILRSSGSGTTSSLHTGTAQGGSASTIILQSTASSTNGFYNDVVVWIYGGQGANQVRWGHSYNGGTRTLSVRQNWVVAPNSTSQYIIIPFPMGFAKWLIAPF